MAPDQKLTGPQMGAAYLALVATSDWFRRQYHGHRRNPFMDAIRALMVDLAARANVKACRFCGCTERYGCDVGGHGCSWVAPSVCSHPACARALYRERQAGRAS